MSDNPKVSIVMLCYNRVDDVREGIKKLQNQSYKNIEIIAVDNCSDDGTAQMVRSTFPEVIMLEMPRNMGIEAYNVGFKNANGEYIVILDDDSFPGKYTIENMVKKFENDKRLGIAAFDIKSYASYSEEADEVYPSPDVSEENENYLMSFNGCGVGIRRKLFESVGFYPEEFFLYFNEMDVAFRVLDKGYKCRCFTDLVGYHKASPTNRASKRAPYYYTRNAFWLVWKNYPSDMLLTETFNLIYLCIYNCFKQRTTIYLQAFANALLGVENIKGKRKPVKRVIAKKLRVSFETAFTFYR